MSMPNQDARYIEGIGRRKTAVARVRLYPSGTLGGGTSSEPTFFVNHKPSAEYFPMIAQRGFLRQPFVATGTTGAFDVSVMVRGGGPLAQAAAVRLGIARALVKHTATFRSVLRSTDLLTRDPRKKERKKPGLRRARRAPQWQKR